MSDNKTYNFINSLKVVSAVLIYTLHYIGIYYVRTGQNSKVLMFICNICYFAIPVFFMCTGYVYRNRDIDYKYVLKKIVFYYMLIILINMVSYIAKDIFTKEISINYIKERLTDSLLLKGLTPHLWFLKPLFSIYLLLPLFVKLDSKSLKIITLIGIFFVVFKKDLPFINKLEFNFPLSYYIVLSLTGAMYKECSKKEKLFFLLFFIICTLIYKLLNRSIWFGGYGDSIYYNFAAIGHNASDIFCMSNIIFIVFDILDIQNKTFDKVAKLSLYIYLLHPFFIHIIFDIMKINNRLLVLILYFVTYIIMCIAFYHYDKLYRLFKNKIYRGNYG